jgi:hypothetical protein
MPKRSLVKKSRKEQTRFVPVSEKQIAMLCEALGLVDALCPYYRDAALAFARGAAPLLNESVRFLERAETLRAVQTAKQNLSLFGEGGDVKA